jgi:chaperonin GroES
LEETVKERSGFTMNIQPLGNRIIIKEIRKEEKTKSGIVLTDSVQEGPNIGLVLAIGTGSKEFELQVEDVILFHEHSGTKVNLNNEEYLIIDEVDILAITKI